MISLSKEWAILSKEMYGQEFTDELGEFLKEHKVKDILECGCGDGYILQGLAKKGFSGIGIDATPEMIALALEDHNHPNISYRQMDWLNLRNLKIQFDTVICRGNSLSCVSNWGKQEINPEQAKRKIEESVGLFYQKLKKGGLLYVDTISQNELDKNGGDIEVKTVNIHLVGRIEYDWQKKERRVFGSGKVLGEDFSGSSTSYLLTPQELEGIVRNFQNREVWTPQLKNERNYTVICAIK